LISKSDYNLKSGCTPKSIRETEKSPKNPPLGKKPKKKKKKTQKTQKNSKTTGLGLKKTGFFPTLIGLVLFLPL
jgi:hypothetical protein